MTLCHIINRREVKKAFLFKYIIQTRVVYEVSGKISNEKSPPSLRIDRYVRVVTVNRREIRQIAFHRRAVRIFNLAALIQN